MLVLDASQSCFVDLERKGFANYDRHMSPVVGPIAKTSLVYEEFSEFETHD
jgi:hypothetical protein